MAKALMADKSNPVAEIAKRFGRGEVLDSHFSGLGLGRSGQHVTDFFERGHCFGQLSPLCQSSRH